MTNPKPYTKAEVDAALEDVPDVVKRYVHDLVTNDGAAALQRATAAEDQVRALTARVHELEGQVGRYHETLKTNLRASWTVADVLEEYELTMKLRD